MIELRHVALFLPLAAALVTGCAETDDDAPALCEDAKCDGQFSGIRIAFSERLSGRFHEGEVDADPALLDGKASAGVAAEIRVTQTIVDFARFLSDREHAIELSGEIRIARLGSRLDIVAPVESGSYFSYLPVNTHTGEREFRYVVRFSLDGEQHTLRVTKFVQRETRKSGVIDDLPAVLPEVLRDTSIAYGELLNERSGQVLGVARLVFPGVESRTWDDIIDAARFFTSFEVSGGSVGQRIAARHRLLTFTNDILTDVYFPSATERIAGDRVPLRDLLATVDAETLCAGRTDAICSALVDVERGGGEPAHRALTAAIRLRMSEDRAAALRDPAIHHYIRERGPVLFATAHATATGRAPARVLAEHYPAYAAADFKLVSTAGIAEPIECTRREALLFAPGLYRAAGRDEMREFFAALRAAFPCIEIVRSDPQGYATRQQAADALYVAFKTVPADVPLHLLSHSAGANAVTLALAQHSDLAARTRSVVSLQPTARGTQVASLLDRLFVGLAGQAIADQTPEACAQFWVTHGASLPRDVLYLTLRGIVLYPEHNIPTSNRPFYRQLRAVDAMRTPYNDMQARLTAQVFGSHVATTEVLAKVLEGNHYQWGLARGDVPEWLMPAEMADRIPRAAHMLSYYRALHEIGVFAR